MSIITAPTRLVGLLAFASLLASSSPVQAQAYPVQVQTYLGIAGGLNYAGPSPSRDPQGTAHYTRGFAFQGSIGRRFSDRLGVRLDAFLNHFAIQQPPMFVGVACPRAGPCGKPPWSDGFSDPVGLTGLTASMRLFVDPPHVPSRMYVIAGLGAYYVYQHPTAAASVRTGASAGGGFATRVHGRSAVFVEARYHHLFSAPSHPTWLVPLTFGFTF